MPAQVAGQLQASWPAKGALLCTCNGPGLLASCRVLVTLSCAGEVLRKLAANYLGVKGHQVLDQLDALMTPALRISPADITAKLDMDRCNPDRALNRVLQMVQSRSTA